MPVIYADVVFAVNVLMDGVILIATCLVVKRPIRPWRLSAGALFGALYALLLFVPHLSLLTSLPGKAVASLCMVLICLPYRGLLDLVRNIIVLYCVTFVLAGAVLALHFAAPGMTFASGTVVSGGKVAFQTSVGGLAIVAGIPLGMWLLQAAIGRARQVAHRGRSLVPATAKFGGREVDFVGLLDTGNQLHDPLSGYPVCLLDRLVFAELTPDSMAPLFAEGADLLTVVTELIGDKDVPRLYWIPFRGAGGVQKLTIAFRPDELWLKQEGGGRVMAQPCLLALHMDRLSVDARFQAILHTEILAGDDRHANDQSIESSKNEASNSFATDLDSHSIKG